MEVTVTNTIPAVGQSQPTSATVDTNTSTDTAQETSQAEVTTTAAPQDERLASRLAHISKKEKERVEAENRFKQDKEAFEASRTSEMPVLQAIKAFKENPNDSATAFQLLEAAGISYEALTERILMDLQVEKTEESKQLSIEEQVKAAIKAEKDAELEQERQAALEKGNVALDEFKKSIEQLAESRASDFVYIANTEGSLDMVLDLCVDYFDTYEKLLPLEQAFDEVEKDLQEQVRIQMAKYNIQHNKAAEPVETQTDSRTELPEIKVHEALAPITKEQRVMANPTLPQPKQIQVKKDETMSKDELLALFKKQLG